MHTMISCRFSFVLFSMRSQYLLHSWHLTTSDEMISQFTVILQSLLHLPLFPVDCTVTLITFAGVLRFQFQPERVLKEPRHVRSRCHTSVMMGGHV